MSLGETFRRIGEAGTALGALLKGCAWHLSHTAPKAEQYPSHASFRITPRSQHDHDILWMFELPRRYRHTVIETGPGEGAYQVFCQIEVGRHPPTCPHSNWDTGFQGASYIYDWQPERLNVLKDGRIYTDLTEAMAMRAELDDRAQNRSTDFHAADHSFSTGPV